MTGVLANFEMDNYRRVTSDQLRDWIRRGEQVFLLDVRTPGQFELEYISGSVNVPLENLEPKSLLEHYKQRPIILICTSGKRAYQAADKFIENGFHDVIIVAGGLLAWKVLGFPIIKKKAAQAG